MDSSPNRKLPMQEMQCLIRSHIEVVAARYRNNSKELHSKTTLPETNIAPGNGWLEYYFPFGKDHFQGRTVSFREGNRTYDAH